MPSPAPVKKLFTGKTEKTGKLFREADLVFPRHRSWRKTAEDHEARLYPCGLPEPSTQTHPPFPVFPSFPVNQALALARPGEKAIHREDREDREVVQGGGSRVPSPPIMAKDRKGS